MRVRRLDLTRYGKFTDYPIDFGEHEPGTPDLHIVYGLNEAGKSTALSAYLDLLFGIEERSRYHFLHPYAAMQIGACLEFGGKTHELKRIKQRTNSLLDAADRPVNEAMLSVPLAGLTRDAYRMMFSLDDQTLEDGGNAILESKGDLGQLLFSTSAGLADVSNILEAVSGEADSIYRKRASSTRIAELKRQLTSLKAKREDIDTLASAHAGLVAKLKQAHDAYDEAMQTRGDAKARNDEIMRLLRARPLTDEYRRLSADLLAFAGLPRPPKHWASDLRTLMTDETRLQTQNSGLESRTDRLKHEIDELRVNDQLLSLSDRLDALAESSARFSTAEEDLPKRRSAKLDYDARLKSVLAALEQPQHSDPQKLLISAALVGTLRDLIEERSGFLAAVKSAEKEHSAAKEVLHRLCEDRKENAGTGLIDDSVIASISAILSRLRQSDLLARHRVAERGLPARQRLYDECLAVLAPWSGNGQDLRALRLPDQRQIENWRAKLSALEKRRTDSVDRMRDLTSRQIEDAARIAVIHSSAGAIGDIEAARVRAGRDEAWSRHLAVLHEATALAFAEEMMRTDTIADARIAHAHDLVEQRAIEARHSVTGANIERQAELLAQVDAETTALAAEIRASVPIDIGLVETRSSDNWLLHIERWMKSREEALASWRDLQGSLDELAILKQEMEREREGLAQALNHAGIAAAATSLPDLIQRAETAIAENATRKAASAASDNGIRDRERELTLRQHTLEEARANAGMWEARWQAAVAGTWVSDRASNVGAIREILDASAELAVLLHDRDELHHRIETMERDQDLFTAEVASLLADAGIGLDAGPTINAARALLCVYELARQAQETRRQKRADLERHENEREKLSEEIAIHAARKSELTSFFGVGTIADVAAALERCAIRERLEEKLEGLGTQIVGEMRAESLDAAFERMDQNRLEDLEREGAELTGRLEDVEERTKILFAEESRATDRLNEIGGDDAVSRIESERKTIVLEVEDLAVRYLRLKTGSIVAEQALRAYRDNHRSSMMDRASDAFRSITRGEYTGLAARPEKDRETLIGLPRQGGSKLAVDMSKGTRFQLYLALRLAGYEEFADARPSVPFIADDIMETFDEPRSEEVLRLFEKMASIGQVIYFTHHRHVCEIAKRQIPGVKQHEIRVD